MKETIICFIFMVWIISSIFGGILLDYKYPDIKKGIADAKSLFSSRNLFGKAQVIFLFIIVVWPACLGYLLFKLLFIIIFYIIYAGEKGDLTDDK